MNATNRTAMAVKYFVKVALGLAWALILQPQAWAGTVTYYHNDLVGSPVAATNEAGQLLWREGYRPYGERLTNSSASIDNDVWFTSRRQDETGLVYMGARYYDPVIGRFVSMDPKGFDDNNLHSHNRYAYANNNPYKYVDPDGKAGALATALLGAEAGTIVWPGPGTILGGVAGFAVGAWGTWQVGQLIFNEKSEQTGQGPQSETGRTSNPIQGEPGSCSSCNNSKGEKKQDRYYGSDGWPSKDIDYDHSHKGDDGKPVGKPHAHDWARPEDGGRPSASDRGPARPLQPGEE